MKDTNTYNVFRAFKTDSIENINFDSVGISWAMDYDSADRFASQFGEEYIVVSAEVTADHINIAQTNAQWLSSEHSSEGEVVLNEMENISIEYEGEQFNANTGYADFDETRPEAVECEVSEVTNYLN